MLLQKNTQRYGHNMYHTIHFKPKVYQKQNLKRNCISMENLKATSGGGGYNSKNNSLSRTLKGGKPDKKASNSNQCINISNPVPMNNTGLPSQYFHMPFGYIYDRIEKTGSSAGGGGRGSHNKMSNSKQSLGTNASSDDCFRYRDVAL